MTRLFTSLAAWAALAPLASAGIKFTSPLAGAKLTAGTAITVEWEEGGSGPAITDLLNYQLFLIAGGNDEKDQFQVAIITTQGAFTAGNTASALVTTTVGGKTDKAA